MRFDAWILVLCGLEMLAVGLGSAWWWRRGKPGLWPAFGLGLLAWVVGVALKIAWAVPTNAAIAAGLKGALPPVPYAIVHSIYVGLLTGIFECGLVWVVATRSRLREADFAGAVAFGIGKGAGEAMVLGALTLVSAVGALIFWPLMSPDAQAQLAAATTLSSLVTRPLERLLALAGHAASSVWIVHAVRAGQPGWFWLAFAYLSAIDAVAGAYIEGVGKEHVMERWDFWLVLAAFAALGLWGLFTVRARAAAWPAPRPSEAS